MKFVTVQGKLPATGWTDAQIEQLLQQLSLLDSNNFPHNVGVGEREARIYSGEPYYQANC